MASRGASEYDIGRRLDMPLKRRLQIWHRGAFAVATFLKFLCCDYVVWLFGICRGMISSSICTLHHELSLGGVLSQWLDPVERRLYVTLS